MDRRQFLGNLSLSGLLAVELLNRNSLAFSNSSQQLSEEGLRFTSQSYKDAVIEILVKNQDMENQRIWEHHTMKLMIHEVYQDFPLFDMVSVQPIPLGDEKRGFYQDFPLFDMVSVQPIAQMDEKRGFYLNGNKISSKLLKPKFWLFKAKQDLEIIQDLKALSGVWCSAEKELVSILSMEIKQEIVRKVVSDLRNEAGIKHACNAKRVKDGVKEASNLIKNKCGQDATWVLGNRAVLNSICLDSGFVPTSKSETDLGVNQIGVWDNRWIIFKDELFPSNSLLVGSFQPTLSTGYIYSPIISWNQSPTYLDNESFRPYRRLGGTYAMKMVNPNRYCQLSV